MRTPTSTLPAALTWLLPPRAPALEADVLSALELNGPQFVLAVVSRQLVGTSTTGRIQQVQIGTTLVTYGDVQDWLKWKAAKDAWWVKVGTIAAIAAAFFSLFALALALMSKAT